MLFQVRKLFVLFKITSIQKHENKWNKKLLMINNKTKEKKAKKKLTTGISLDERKHLQLYI